MTTIRKKLQVVVETPEFIKQAKLCMDDALREKFISYIAENPLKGNLVVGAAYEDKNHE